MSVESSTFKKAATAIAPTGGTDQTFTETGNDVQNGIAVSDATVADFRVRPSITYKNRQPVRQADGSWTKAKRSFVLVIPKITADGSTVFNLVRGDVEAHPETTTAEVNELRFLGAQILGSPETLNFFQVGSLRS